MDKLLKDWGMKWNPQIKYDGWHHCPNCDFDLSNQFGVNGEVDRKLIYNNIVGFNVAIPREGRSDAIGILIFDCPACQSKFWCHTVPLIVEAAKYYCQHWPKD